MANAAAPALNQQQKRLLFEDGFVHLPGLVPTALVDEALRAINQSLGTVGLPPELLPTFRASTYTPELVDSEPIRALYHATAAPGVVESAIGLGKVRAPGRGQIALRFPSPTGAPAVPHIDGIAYPGNGVPPGTLQHFTALLGIFLSDVSAPDRGNLTVWPGSHKRVEEHVRTSGLSSLAQGFPKLDLAEPRPLLAKAGDAVLCHYQLAHGIAPNLGPHVRYAVFFRLYHLEHELHGDQPLRDLWHQWEGLRDVVSRP